MSIILDKILTKLDTDIVSHSKIIKDETDANGIVHAAKGKLGE